ncbi:MAG: hypothetical protein J6P94_04735 [Oscillospiraceae bacterium]|nr:hypothetical protein [Oscillospiraceae bacterium]
MTRNQFYEELAVTGGQFNFRTAMHEGMIGISPNSLVIWVDNIGFGESKIDDEPMCFGEFQSIGELLDSFKVDGKLFSESVLPEIDKLYRLLT